MLVCGRLFGPFVCWRPPDPRLSLDVFRALPVECSRFLQRSFSPGALRLKASRWLVITSFFIGVKAPGPTA